MLKWIAGGVAAFLAGRYLLRLKQAGQTIVTRTTLQVNKVSLAGIELKAGVRLQNPNPIALSIQYPFVNLLYNGVSVGSSVVKDEVVQLPENGEQSFDLTIQSAGWLSLTQTLGFDLVQKIRAGQSVVLDLLATITTKVNGIPYQQQDPIKLTL